MDWVKIKNQHVLFSGLTLSEKGMLVMIQSLTGHLERMPTKREILSLPGVSDKSLEKLSKSLRNIDADLSEVLRKVLADVSEVLQKRESEKNRKRNLRSKNQNVPWDIHGTSHGFPIREDKIREDINNNNPPNPPLGDGESLDAMGGFFKNFEEDTVFQTNALTDYLHWKKYHEGFRPKDGTGFRKSCVKKLTKDLDQNFRREFLAAVSDWREHKQRQRDSERTELNRIAELREQATIMLFKMSSEERKSLENRTRIHLELSDTDRDEIDATMSKNDVLINELLRERFQVKV